MKRIILITILSLTLLLVGCVPSSTPSTTEPATVPEPTVEPEPSSPFNTLQPNTNFDFTHQDVLDDTLLEGYGIGSNCMIVGLYPGYYEEVPLLLKNGEDKERSFVIYTVAAHTPTVTGFVPLPEAYLTWFTPKDTKITLGKGEHYWMTIIISMPEDYNVSSFHSELEGLHTNFEDTYAGLRKPGDPDIGTIGAEFKIRVDDVTQTGLVQLAYESKWFLTTTTNTEWIEWAQAKLKG